MLSFPGWGKKKKTRVLRTEPEGIAEIRRQEMGKQSTKDRANGGKAVEELGNEQESKIEEEIITSIQCYGTRRMQIKKQFLSFPTNKRALARIIF